MQDIATKFTPHKRVFTSNTTSASITNPIPTTIEPSGTGVVDLTIGQLAPNFGEFIFFGAGADNAAGTAKIYLWFQVGTLWFPVPVLSLDVTLSTAIGIAGADVIDTDRFADTLAETSGSVNDPAIYVVSPANNTVAKAVVDLLGASKVEVRFAKGTATNLNALIRGY